MSNISAISIDEHIPEGMISFTHQRSKAEDKNLVSELLNIPNTSDWSIIDQEGSLVLVHYAIPTTPNKAPVDMTKYGHLRGVLIDLETGCVVANSFGYTPTAVASHIDKDNDGNIVVYDKDHISHTFESHNCVIRPIFEGVVLRILKYKGKVYNITHRKINPVKSHWGSSGNFLDIYKLANGPSAEQLFDESKPNSSTVYNFLVVDSTLLVGTRQKVHSPYVVLLSTTELKYPFSDEDTAKGIFDFECRSEISAEMETGAVVNITNYTLEQANEHLRDGYYPSTSEDPRTTNGEGVIIYSINENGDIGDIVKVHSEAYDWRVMMRNNNPNIDHQFYSLIDSARYNLIGNNYEAFIDDFALFDEYSPNELKSIYNKNGAITALNLTSIDPNHPYSINRDARIMLIWINYVFTLPPNHQLQAIDIIDKFFLERTRLINWLITIERQNKVLNSVIILNHQELKAPTNNCKNKDPLGEVRSILQRSRNLAYQSKNDPHNKHLPIHTVISNTISNLVYKEYGINVYKLIRIMNYKAPVKPTPITFSQ